MSYYANHDLAAYERLRANYDTEQQHWNASKTLADDAYAAALAGYDEAHAAWVDDPTDVNDDPIPEPQPPPPATYPPEPVAPVEPSTVYEARDADTHEWITTASGDALVVPGRVVLTSDGGATEFALRVDDLAAPYTDTNAALR